MGGALFGFLEDAQEHNIIDVKASSERRSEGETNQHEPPADRSGFVPAAAGEALVRCGSSKAKGGDNARLTDMQRNQTRGT